VVWQVAAGWRSEKFSWHRYELFLSFKRKAWTGWWVMAGVAEEHSIFLARHRDRRRVFVKPGYGHDEWWLPGTGWDVVRHQFLTVAVLARQGDAHCAGLNPWGDAQHQQEALSLEAWVSELWMAAWVIDPPPCVKAWIDHATSHSGFGTQENKIVAFQQRVLYAWIWSVRGWMLVGEDKGAISFLFSVLHLSTWSLDLFCTSLFQEKGRQWTISL
jgi:hypothetical protein